MSTLNDYPELAPIVEKRRRDQQQRQTRADRSSLLHVLLGLSMASPDVLEAAINLKGLPLSLRAILEDMQAGSPDRLAAWLRERGLEVAEGQRPSEALMAGLRAMGESGPKLKALDER